jgi:hypothetical protein
VQTQVEREAGGRVSTAACEPPYSAALSLAERTNSPIASTLLLRCPNTRPELLWLLRNG